MPAKKYNIMNGIASVEGASTGQPTDLNSSAVGKWQMTKSTREAMYRKLGYTDMVGAEREYRRNPAFEKRVADMYRDELDSRIPKNITGKEREYRIAKGWYTGDVNFPDGVIPHPEAGNELTAAEYAKQATGFKGIPFKNTKTVAGNKWDPLYIKAQEDKTKSRDFASMPRLETTPQSKANIVGKAISYPSTPSTNTREGRIQSTKQKLSGIGSSLTPYLSNIYNAFQKPAPVPAPVYNSPVRLQRVNFDNDRYEVSKDYRTDRLNADQTLDANTAAAVKQYAKGQKFSSMSKINQEERNANIGIANKELGLNASIAAGNNDILRNYREQQAERQNAITSDRMANIANATDKFTMSQNVKAQYDLDQRKLDILEATDQYGTDARLRERLKRIEGERSYKMGGRIPKYSAGFVMKKLKPVY